MKTSPNIVRKVSTETLCRDVEPEVVNNRCTKRLEMSNDCSDNTTVDGISNIADDDDNNHMNDEVIYEICDNNIITQQTEAKKKFS